MKDRHYWTGRLARAEGKPRELIDGRYSPPSRQEWFRGWDEENALRAPKLTVEQRQQLKAGFSAMRAAVDSL